MACATLEKTSSLKPSSKTTALWYLKLVTVRSFCPFTLISLWMSLALFVISCVAWASSSSSSSARASTPSANRRLAIALPSMLAFPYCSSKAPRHDPFEKMLKRVDDRRHPCLYSNSTEPFFRVPIHLDCICSLVLELFQVVN